MFTRIKNNLASRVSPTGEHLSELRAVLRTRMGCFRHQRSASAQKELTEDFSQVLAAWGIADEGSIPGVITALRLRLLVFAAPVLACMITAVFRQDLALLLTLALVAPPCLLGIATTVWRISILQSRRFLPLSHWLSFRNRP